MKKIVTYMLWPKYISNVKLQTFFPKIYIFRKFM